MTKLSVLIVDDASFIREMVSKTLRKKFPDMQIADAVDGRKAQQLMEKSTFDLILCDWEMPEMSGIELLAWIRKEQKSKVPFIMVTSRGDKADLVEALQAGATDYMGKPFSSENLIAKVVKALEKRQASRAAESRAGLGAFATKPVAKKTAAKPAASKKADKEPQPFKSKGVAQLCFGNKSNPCQIKALSLKQIVLIGKINDSLPTILETVIVDLDQNQQKNNEVARLNAFVHSLQANDHNSSCEEVTMTFNIADQDPNKLSYLSKMIATGTTQASYVPGA